VTPGDSLYVPPGREGSNGGCSYPFSSFLVVTRLITAYSLPFSFFLRVRWSRELKVAKDDDLFLLLFFPFFFVSVFADVLRLLLFFFSKRNLLHSGLFPSCLLRISITTISFLFDFFRLFIHVPLYVRPKPLPFFFFPGCFGRLAGLVFFVFFFWFFPVTVNDEEHLSPLPPFLSALNSSGLPCPTQKAYSSGLFF